MAQEYASYWNGFRLSDEGSRGKFAWARIDGEVIELTCDRDECIEAVVDEWIEEHTPETEAQEVAA